MSPTKRPFQPTFLAFSRQPLEEGDQFWMAPIAVARQPHDLPGRAVDRQRHGAGETTGRSRSRSSGRRAEPARSCARTVPSPASTANRDAASGGSGALSSVPGSCASAGAVAASSKATNRASEMRISALRCRRAAWELSAEMPRRAPGGDTLPRVVRPVQPRTGRRLRRRAPAAAVRWPHAARRCRHAGCGRW